MNNVIRNLSLTTSQSLYLISMAQPRCFAVVIIVASLLGYLLSAVKPELPHSPVIYVIYMLFMVMGHPGLYRDPIRDPCSMANYAAWQRHNSMGGGLHILNHKQPELKVKKHLNPRRLLVKRHWHCTPMNSDPKHELPELSRECSRLHPSVSPSLSGLAPRRTSLSTDKH